MFDDRKYHQFCDFSKNRAERNMLPGVVHLCSYVSFLSHEVADGFIVMSISSEQRCVLCASIFGVLCYAAAQKCYAELH